jgi:hypothetical protein
MRFGFALPQVGSAVGPEALVSVAKRAEELGFDSLWVLDRILWPVNPRAPYPIGDGSLPVKYKSVLDPLETLTFCRRAHTPRRAGDERPQSSLVHPRFARATADDPRYLFWRTTKSRIGHRMVARRIRSCGRGLARAWQTRRRINPGPQENLDHRSGGIAGQILSDPEIGHRSQARAETASADLYGSLLP